MSEALFFPKQTAGSGSGSIVNTTNLIKGDGAGAGVDSGIVATSVDQILVPTAVKTGAYNAAVGDMVIVDTTSGSVTVTLPTAPADKSIIGIKHVKRGSTNTVTYACGGSDVLNIASGATTGTLTLLAHAVTLQYKSPGGIWYVITDDLPYGSLLANAQTWSGTQTFVAPALGTPASGNITNCTSSGQVLVAPILGTPASGDLSNCTSTGQVLTAPILGTPASGTLTNCTGLPESGVTSLVSDLALKAPLASPTLTGTITITGSGGATIDNSSASAGTISSTGGGQFNITAPIQLSGAVKDSTGSLGTANYSLVTDGAGAVKYVFTRRSTEVAFLSYSVTTTAGSPTSTAAFFGGNNRTIKGFDSTGYTQARMKATVCGTASNATTTVFPRYFTASSSTFSDFLPGGASSTDISVTLSTSQNTAFVGGWINLTAGAIGDVFWVVCFKDSASGALTPTWSEVVMEFR